ncbi:unnamed protein product [Acanthoscelides obtectus]|uniref:Uncharacterized protein n=1 Tax=Acanthoscelides obtectus TaxID=200917 RepID=A0A9P0PMK0_ACAOB|nr:unnamed protein product [Acanthoscelides obtectus]CAK1636538.1 hypothetical protein AOBTE_LOCUS9878 [Acanthoscelides obtectus]
MFVDNRDQVADLESHIKIYNIY